MIRQVELLSGWLILTTLCRARKCARRQRSLLSRRKRPSSADPRGRYKSYSNEWHTLRLKAEDERFTIGFDGKTLFTSTDKTLANAGRVALWTKSDSVTRFDQIAIDVLPSRK